jgi:DNA end-binding protein Ku
MNSGRPWLFSRRLPLPIYLIMPVSPTKRGAVGMAQRPIWRGYLRLALVSCPVALYAAKHDRGSIHFNLINPKTGNRIRMITQDAETDDPVERRDLVKGYEFKKNTYVLLNNEDFESVKVESSSVMTIEKFVEADSIDPLYYDMSYFLAPDGDAGRDVYAVLYEAVEATGRVALSRVVIVSRSTIVDGIAVALFDGLPTSASRCL